MYEKFLAIFLIIVVVGVSGCTINPKSQNTWGEKEPVSVNYLHIINSTGEHYVKNGTNYYYIYGYIKNNAEYNALNVEMHAKVYDNQGNLIQTNDSKYIKLKYIPTNGISYYCLTFKDPENKIARYELKVLTKN